MSFLINNDIELRMLEIYPDENPLVTVIMVTFNRADYLKRSITSYLNQTFTNSELLIVDDGSNDKTFGVIKDFMDEHKNIRYLRHSNRRISLSKNAGIKAAAGKYIAFLDSDDEYRPDFLEKRVRFMQTHPNIDMIEGGVIIIGDPFIADKNDLSKKIHLAECHIGSTFFGKVESFLALGGFNKNTSYSEDSEFWENAEKMLNLRKICHPGYVYYRDTPGSISNSISASVKLK